MSTTSTSVRTVGRSSPAAATTRCDSGTFEAPLQIGDTLVPHKDTGDGVEVHSVDFSPDGRLRPTSSLYDPTRIWDVATRTLVGGSMPGILGTRTKRALFSPDGQMFVTCGSSSSPMEIWETATRKRLGALGDKRAISAAFAPDGEDARRRRR